MCIRDSCEDVPDAAYKLAERFWPGPLTMILKKKPCVPLRTPGGLETVGMRCPDHAVTRAIIEKAGVPVAAPSANTSVSYTHLDVYKRQARE